MSDSWSARSVFLNCPFDPAYRPLLHALVFTVSHAGLIPRCALEIDDSAEVRLDKIFRIIGECRFGIHDISRVGLDAATALPRFNMPLELGIFLGCKRFGDAGQSRKRCLILDTELYRYRAFLSDLSGQDIHAHRDDPRRLIGEVRAWLRSAAARKHMPGGEEIWQRYSVFLRELPRIAEESRILPEELTFVDYARAVSDWLRRTFTGRAERRPSVRSR